LNSQDYIKKKRSRAKNKAIRAEGDYGGPRKHPQKDQRIKREKEPSRLEQNANGIKEKGGVLSARMKFAKKG